jgi:hypothetical protein
MSDRRYFAGDSVDDLCRVCKDVRRHTVLAAGDDGTILRVVCAYCMSAHRYRRGGPSTEASAPRAGAPRATTSSERQTFPLVSERERSTPAMALGTDVDLEMLLRRIIREETGLTPVAPADKWIGGALVLKPGKPGVQEKSIPIETFFHKMVMLRNRLRVLEQQLGGSALSEEEKIKLQSYITGCYGTLTTFNVLFADDDDRFVGSGGGD